MIGITCSMLHDFLTLSSSSHYKRLLALRHEKHLNLQSRKSRRIHFADDARNLFLYEGQPRIYISVPGFLKPCITENMCQSYNDCQNQ
jgi:hypothetical protein